MWQKVFQPRCAESSVRSVEFLIQDVAILIAKSAQLAAGGGFFQNELDFFGRRAGG
jgi:hypothetical protein